MPIIVKARDIFVSESAEFAEFTISLDRASTTNITLRYRTSGGTATSGSDYELIDQSLVFAAGETTKVIRIPLKNADTMREGFESFFLSLSTNQPDVLFANSLVLATIVDNDTAAQTPFVSISDPIVDEQSGFAYFTLNLSGAKSTPLTLTMSTRDGNATAGSDYVALTNHAVTFAAGEVSKTVAVQILNDTALEAAELFSLVVDTTNLTGAVMTDNVGTAIVGASDQAASDVINVSVADIVLSETAPFAEFVVTLDRPSNGPVVLSYETSNGTAGFGDYESISGIPNPSIVFAAGETTRTVRVPILRDTTAGEVDESFFLLLSSAQSGVKIERSRAIATVVDNSFTTSNTPTLIIDDPVVDEAAGFVYFTLRLSEDTVNEVAITVSTQNGSALAGSDYLGIQNQPVSFLPGETAKVVAVQILNDSALESAETFSLLVDKASARGVQVFDNVGMATIGHSDRTASAQVIVSAQDIVVGEGAAYAEFVLQLDRPSSGRVTVNCDTNRNANDTNDIFDLFQSVTFAAGETTKVVRIPLKNADTTRENFESFFLNLSTTQADVLIANSRVLATMVDNDTAAQTPFVSISDPIVDEQSGFAYFTLNLSGAKSTPLTLTMSTRDGNATAGSDYVALTNHAVTFAAGEVSKTVAVQILNDAALEAAESFSLVVDTTNLTGAVMTDNVGTAIVGASDQAASDVINVSVADIVLSETAPFAEFVVTLDRPSNGPVVLAYRTFNGTADFGDYQSISGTPNPSLVFAAGETTRTVRVPIVRDTTAGEVDESFFLQLSSAQSGVKIERSLATATVVDNSFTTSNTPTLIIDDPVVDEAAGFVYFTLRLSEDTVNEVAITVSTQNGSARSGFDYLGIQNQPVSFLPGETAKVVAVQILNDSALESAETFSLLVDKASARGVQVFDNVGMATIGHSDRTASAQVIVSAQDIVVGEGAAYAEFVLQLDRPSSGRVTVDCSTSSSTAGSDDFFALFQSVTFASGETTKVVRIPLKNADTTRESVESFFLSLSTNQADVLIANSRVLATMVDNDTAAQTPFVSISDPIVDEQSGFAYFTLNLSGAKSTPLTLTMSTRDGNATAGSDYVALTNHAVTFAAGEVSKTVAVQILNDAALEAAESFSLVVDTTNLTGAVMTDNVGTAIVGASDQAASDVINVSVADIVLSETAPFAEFVVTLDRPSNGPVVLAYRTFNGTADSGDYQPISGTPNPSIVFAAGETTRTIRVPIVSADINAEQTETFQLSLSSQQNNVNFIKGSASASLVDNDTTSANPSISLSDVVVNEEQGIAFLTFNLSTASASEVSFKLNSQDGSATAGTDYQLMSNEPVSFAPGETSKTIVVQLLDDVSVEEAETFAVNLSDVRNATATDTSAQVTIDRSTELAVQRPVVITVEDALINENAGVGTFRVSLNQASNSDIVLSYSTTGIRAIDGFQGDYERASGVSIVIAAGQTSQLIQIPVSNDTSVEPDETFLLNLATNSSNARLTEQFAYGLILDDDSRISNPTLSVKDIVVDEGQRIAYFDYVLNTPSDTVVSFNVSTRNGSAQAGSDYQSISNQRVTFNPGERFKTVAIQLNNDSTVESAESFFLDVVAGTLSGATLHDPEAEAVISGNDQAFDQQYVRVSIRDIMVTEQDRFAEFTVTLDKPSATLVRVDYATVSDTAISGFNGDYSGTNSTPLLFAPGETVKTIRIPIYDEVNERMVEPNKSFSVFLGSTDPRVQFLKDRANAVLLDNELVSASPLLTISDAVVNESDGFAYFTLSLDAASQSAVSLRVSTANGTATVDQDYAALRNHLVSFNPGERVKTVAVRLLNDSAVETDEAFSLQVDAGSLTGARIFDDKAAGLIAANDQATENKALFISSRPLTVNETEAYAEFAITLNRPSNGDVTIFYQTVDVLSFSGSNGDFAAVGPRELTFAPGETVKTVRVFINPNSDQESRDTFALFLSNDRSDVIIKEPFVYATIENDGSRSATPLVSITDTVVDEASGFAYFTLSLDQAASDDGVRLLVSTRDLDASGNQDYVSLVAEKVQFAAGERVKTVAVQLKEDLLGEALERFALDITNDADSRAVILDSSGTAFVLDNDAAPSAESVVVSTNDVFVNESDAFAEFVLTLDRPSSNSVVLQYRSSFESASDGSNGDYASVLNTVVFAPGEVVKRLKVALNQDSSTEQIESFSLLLSSTQPGVRLEQSRVTAFIHDDDALDSTPTVSISDISVNESESLAYFTVSLNASSVNPVSLRVSTQDGTALAGQDYVALTDHLLTFTPGQRVKTVAVQLKNDVTAESDESFGLRVVTGSLNGAVAPDAGGTALISRNDQAATASPVLVDVSDAFVNESAGYAEFTVTASRPSESPLSLFYQSRPLTAASGFGGDFVSVLSTIEFAPGETIKTVRIPIQNDSTGEISESFVLALSSDDSEVVLVRPEAYGFIEANDFQAGSPALSISDAIIDESAGQARFVFSLDTPFGSALSFNVSTRDITAKAGSDYVAVRNETVHFLAGETSKTFTVQLINDATRESSERFGLLVTPPQGTAPSDVEGTAIIIDNDQAVTPTSRVFIDDLKVAESDRAIQVLVRLESPAANNVSLTLATQAISAVSNRDYPGIANLNLTFAPGEVAKRVTIPLYDDFQAEGTEQFRVNLSTSQPGVDIIDGQAVITLVDNEIARNDGSVSARPVLAYGHSDDTYELSNPDTVIIETVDAGIDLVKSSLNAYTLEENIENGRVMLTTPADLTGNALDNVLFAGNGDNVLDGQAGNDTVSYLFSSSAVSVSLLSVDLQATGGSGNDRLLNVESLEGSAFADQLTGNGGNNTLTGGAGADNLTGGAGSDTYVVNLTRSAALEDTVNEQGPASDIDTLRLTGSSRNTSSVGLTLAATLENLDASSTGSSRLNLAGNASNNTIIGNLAANSISGGDGNDSIRAGSGNDTLVGGAGADTLVGESGNDVYEVALTSGGLLEDTISETGSSADIDTLRLTGNSTNTTSTTIILAASLEYLDASSTGSSKLNLAGNSASNIITGNAAANSISGGNGNDSISGGNGNDTLTGGSGADMLIFSGGSGTAGSVARVSSLGVDTLTDFTSADDTIALAVAAFGGTVGSFNANQISVLETVDTVIATDSSQNLNTGNFSLAAAGLVLVGANSAGSTAGLYFFDGSVTSGASTTVAGLLASGDMAQLANVTLVGSGFAANDFQLV